MQKRTISLKLQTTSEQAQALADLARMFAAACNVAAHAAREHRCWNAVNLHHVVYYVLRAQFPSLGAQLACQAIRRVADAYKALNVKKKILLSEPMPELSFRPTSVHFDKRTYSLFKNQQLSLFTLNKRTAVSFAMGDYQSRLLSSGIAKEATLICRKGTWYFQLVLDIPSLPLVVGKRFGVDVGENNLAATNTGKVLGGGALRHRRDKFLAHRRRLQSNGSQSAKKRLRHISGREQRHVKHVNHEISKAIVSEALRTGAGEIRLEDLTHIRARIKAGKRVRSRLHRWAFRQLQSFIEYKALALGLSVVYINPAYTSQNCSVCKKLGRRLKHRFSCPSCGHRAHSDVNASCNIAGFAEPIDSTRGVVNHPNVAMDLHRL